MIRYPANFMWGASTASHQVEGNTHNQWSIWEQQKAVPLASTATRRLSWLPNYQVIEPQATDPANYLSGAGADHYKRYTEDFSILSQLQMNTYRFSIEWSRLQPSQGEWDQDAIEHYRAYIQALKANNIEPVLTLWHWTLPVWFAAKGGFEKRKNLQFFEKYVTKIIELFGDQLQYVITLNEPNVYTGFSYLAGEWPPQRKNPIQAWRVYKNLVEAHKRSYTIIKDAQPTIQIGVAAQLADMHPAYKSVVNKAVVHTREYLWNWWFVDQIKHHQDFIGVNYYFTEYIDWKGSPKNPNQPVSDLGWYMEPRGIGTLLQKVYSRYEMPIIITENGLADSQDKQRGWWIEQTLLGLEDALAKGVDLRGYLHWSLLDNFEWAYGWWPKFGLVAIDLETKHRTIRPSAYIFAQAIKDRTANS